MRLASRQSGVGFPVSLTPPLPSALWQVAQLFAEKIFFPSAGRPGTSGAGGAAASAAPARRAAMDAATATRDRFDFMTDSSDGYGRGPRKNRHECTVAAARKPTRDPVPPAATTRCART